MNTTRVLPWVVLIGLVVFTAVTYAELPAEIPTQISSRGTLTHTAPKSFITWFLLVGIAGLTQALLTGITLFLPRHPALFNFPAKEKFLQLPRDYQRPVIARMQFTLDIIGAFTMLTMACVQWMLWRTATGPALESGLAWLMGLTVCIAPLAFLLVGRVSDEVDRQEQRAREAGAVSAGTDR